MVLPASGLAAPRRFAAAALLPLLVTGALRAQLSPRGGELQVNAYTTGTQGGAAVAHDGSGGFVLSWFSAGSAGTDLFDPSIQATRLSGAGAPLLGELQVNAYTTGEQRDASVGVGPLGSFVVVWQSEGSPGDDTSSTSIQGQRFAADGSPLGGQFQVNTYSTSAQTSPSVAVNGTGGFVVVWQSLGSPGDDSSAASIQGRRFDPAGTPAGPQFQINTYTTDQQSFATVGAASSGAFVVTWWSLGSPGDDDSYNSIQARRFNASGTPLGAQFQVNVYTTLHQFNPEVAVAAGGSFVVVWGSIGSFGDDDLSSSIQARTYDAAGAPAGGQFQVNTYTTANQHQPDVATDGQGRFVVAWQSEGSFDGDLDDYSIQVQRFAADGAPIGGQTQINTYTTGWQGDPGVAADALGNFIVTWESSGSDGPDLDGSSRARLYDELFRDGFEAGNSARWSTTSS
jgi:hypothetical protein